jgi:hypothetical protein
MDAKRKLSALRKKVRLSVERTQSVHTDVVDSRERKKLKLEPAPKIAPKPPKPVNATDVERWMREGILELYGDSFIIAKWTVKQKTLAKKLLSIYGAKMTETAVRMYCKEWPEMVANSNGRVKGQPTINLLWALKDRVFAEVQGADAFHTKISKKNSDEFVEDDGTPDIGW